MNKVQIPAISGMSGVSLGAFDFFPLYMSLLFVAAFVVVVSLMLFFSFLPAYFLLPMSGFSYYLHFGVFENLFFLNPLFLSYLIYQYYNGNLM